MNVFQTHTDIDIVIRDGYGWTDLDLDLGHDFVNRFRHSVTENT